jgi:hypothetical protein
MTTPRSASSNARSTSWQCPSWRGVIAVSRQVLLNASSKKPRSSRSVTSSARRCRVVAAEHTIKEPALFRIIEANHRHGAQLTLMSVRLRACRTSAIR